MKNTSTVLQCFTTQQTPVALMPSFTLSQKIGAVCGILGVALMLSVGSYFAFFGNNNDVMINASDDNYSVSTGSKNEIEQPNNNFDDSSKNDLFREDEDEEEEAAENEKALVIEQETIHEILLEVRKCSPAFSGKSSTDLSSLIAIIESLGDAEQLALGQALRPLFLRQFKEYNVSWGKLSTGRGDVFKILEEYKEISVRAGVFSKISKHMYPDFLNHPEVFAALDSFILMGQQLSDITNPFIHAS